MRECTDSLAIVTRYQKRISGPLLDRIDIHVEVPRVEFEKIAGDCHLEKSEAVRRRVAEAREYCPVDDSGRSLLRSAMNQLQMSARAFHHILKLARTIADLGAEEKITTAHLAESLQYRTGRGGWGKIF